MENHLLVYFWNYYNINLLFNLLLICVIYYVKRVRYSNIIYPKLPKLWKTLEGLVKFGEISSIF